MQSLATQLLGASRAAILAALYLRPEESMHVREIARATGISPGTLHRELRALSDLGLLTRREVGRQVFYAADRSSPVFEEISGLLRKTAGLADVLRASLAPLADRLRAAFVYGSMAAGTAGPRSDIDIMAIGSADFADVVKALHPAQASLAREINPTVMTPAEFNARRRARDGFVQSVAKGPKIWLIGDDDDLAESRKDRPAQAARRNAR
ncbi:MAG: helix-turn-helix domain-containing protein [Burkholderiaceae bacterium]|nr:helix-turn-helix domain-containing protein [Burkholderiaceae bacterium]